MTTERHTIEQRTAAPLRLALRERLPSVGLGAGLALGLAALVVYGFAGDHPAMLVLWLSALAALAAAFWSRSASLPRIALIDLAAPALLVLALAPLYLLLLYRWPVQVSSDEVAIMSVSRTYADGTHGADIFGPSEYLGRPTLLFLLWGNLGQLLGGIDLFHMRLVHAVFGLLVVAAAYALFRQLFPRGWALFAAFVLGVSHSFLMISRLAMRENTAVLVEVVALALLLWGLRHEHPLVTFAGGFVAGLGFYTYFPGRATFPLWLAFLLGAAILFRSRFSLRRLVRLGAVAAAGFVLMAGPIVIAERQAPSETTAAQRESLLIYAEGRRVQRDWVFADSVADGVKTNIKWGLTTFNNRVVDHSWIYENHGHGFVDPLTGILLWIGAGIVLVALARQRSGPGGLLMVGSFAVLWLSFAFVVNKAPNYTRLLITLPFVAYLVTVAVRWLAERVRRRYGLRYAAGALTVGVATVLAAWNLSIGWDFVQTGRQQGDDIGSTGRFIASVRDRPGQSFYLAASESVPYYEWGWPGIWQERMRIFARDRQPTVVVDPKAMREFHAPPPFSLFMPAEVWNAAQPSLTRRYPQARLSKVTADGTHLVLDVPS